MVVVPDLDRRAPRPDGHGGLHAAAGTDGQGLRTPPAASTCTCAAESEEDRAELVRLLYVATTRAADYLILSAGVPKLGSTKGPWTELLSRRFDLQSGQLCGTLPDGYPPPQIKVTTSAPPLQSEPAGTGRRCNLPKLLEEAKTMAEMGEARLPPYVAPVPVDTSARQQYSFSRLTGKVHGPRPVARPEAFDIDAEEEPLLDPRELGTLVHAVLAEIDFANPGDIAGLVRRHAVQHLPDGRAGAEEAIELIERFLASPRAAAIAAARQVHTELEFLLAWPGRGSGVGGRGPEIGDRRSGGGGRGEEVRDEAGLQSAKCKMQSAKCKVQNADLSLRSPALDPRPPKYLQGFIDCLYEDAAGRWWLVDYKTNQVTAATVASTAAGYEMQMLVYALAVERILKRPPDGLILCFLRPGVEHTFDWNDEARRRAGELVNVAIENLEYREGKAS